MKAPYLDANTCGAPHADLSDGKVDVVFVRKSAASNLRTTFLFKDLQDGNTIASNPAFEYRKAKAIYLEPLEQRGTIMLDGEKLSLERMKIEACEKVLTFICPQEISFPVVPMENK